MRIGIFGARGDPQTQALTRQLESLGTHVPLIESDALERGEPLSFLDDKGTYQHRPLPRCDAYFIRQVPLAYAPYLEKDDQLVLLQDWHRRYMESRERASFYLSWLLQLADEGVPVVNPPEAASVLRYKPRQLHLLRRLGADVPETLLTNDMEAVRAFHRRKKALIIKPLTGGALTQPVDEALLQQDQALRASPSIVQERVDGEDLRVMVVGGRVVSCVAVVTETQHLDFRGDPQYQGGAATYREVDLPSRISRLCVQAARASKLSFAGIDIKHSVRRWTFLELNSSPIYLDVELKLGHPITNALARHLVLLGKKRRR